MKYYIYNPFPQNHIFFVECLKKYYLEKNNDVEEIQKIDKNENDKNVVYFIIINHMFFIENHEAQKDLIKLTEKKNKILYITEPLELLIERQYYQKLIKKLIPIKIYTYCEENRNKLKIFITIQNFYPINKDYLNFKNKEITENKEKNKEKIVFIGKINKYREQLYDIFGNDLVIYEDKYLKEEWKEIINNFKYFVNVHRRANSRCFESFRLIPLIQNDVIILSEHVNKIEEEKYKNIYFCNLNEMKHKFDILKKNQSITKD